MARIAENTVIVDGQEYKPGDVIPDFKSIKCVDTREPRKYQGLSVDVSVLNDVIAKYASGGASCFMSDTGEYYEYDRKEKTWKLITNITERGFDSEKAYGALKHMLNLKNEVIDTSVKSWLDNHPEATTTVQDGSITELKISGSFLPFIKNIYITPQMFGAVGDGVTDDTEALQSMFDRAGHGSTVFFEVGKYLISKTIYLKKMVNIIGESEGKDYFQNVAAIVASENFVGDVLFSVGEEWNIEGGKWTNPVANQRVSVCGLSFIADAFSISLTGNISNNNNLNDAYHIDNKRATMISGIRLGANGYVEKCHFFGFNGVALYAYGYNRIFNVTFSNCNYGAVMQFDNIMLDVHLDKCVYPLTVGTNNFSNSTLSSCNICESLWFNMTAGIAIKINGFKNIISNFICDQVNYNSIYVKGHNNRITNFVISRGNQYYAGFNDVLSLEKNDIHKAFFIVLDAAFNTKIDGTLSYENYSSDKNVENSQTPGYSIYVLNYISGSDIVLNVDERIDSKTLTKDNIKKIIWGSTLNSDKAAFTSGRILTPRHHLIYDDFYFSSYDSNAFSTVTIDGVKLLNETRYTNVTPKHIGELIKDSTGELYIAYGENKGEFIKIGFS